MHMLLLDKAERSCTYHTVSAARLRLTFPMTTIVFVVIASSFMSAVLQGVT